MEDNVEAARTWGAVGAVLTRHSHPRPAMGKPGSMCKILRICGLPYKPDGFVCLRQGSAAGTVR